MEIFLKPWTKNEEHIFQKYSVTKVNYPTNKIFSSLSSLFSNQNFVIFEVRIFFQSMTSKYDC